jgi:hypothetical protein
MTFFTLHARDLIETRQKFVQMGPTSLDFCANQHQPPRASYTLAGAYRLGSEQASATIA